MKRLILTIALMALITAPAFGNVTLDGVSPHLGWWAPGAGGSTHQYWDFMANVAVDGATYDWIASPPTELENTAAATLIGNGSGEVIYDIANGLFTHDTAIAVTLNIKNYPPNAYKEIWVDIGFTGTLINPDADGVGPVTYITTVLPPFGDPYGVAEMGFRIVPNPTEEYVSFTILAPQEGLTAQGGPAVLDWVHVDTICIPEPATISLLGLGSLGWLRKRRA